MLFEEFVATVNNSSTPSSMSDLVVPISSTPEFHQSPSKWWPDSPSRMFPYHGGLLDPPDLSFSPLWNLTDDDAINSDPLPQYFGQLLMLMEKVSDFIASNAGYVTMVPFRQHGIFRWPSQRRSNLSEGAKTAKDISCSPTAAGKLNLLPDADGPSEQQEENGKLACNSGSNIYHAKAGDRMTVSNHQEKTPTRPVSVKGSSGYNRKTITRKRKYIGTGLEKVSGDQSSEISRVTIGPCAWTISMKVIYGEDIIKFDFSSTSGISKLKKEVGKRLSLDTDSLDIKYLDNDKDWILMKL